MLVLMEQWPEKDLKKFPTTSILVNPLKERFLKLISRNKQTFCERKAFYNLFIPVTKSANWILLFYKIMPKKCIDIVVSL